jgi:hypothetical protein
MEKLTLIDEMTKIEYEFPTWLIKIKIGRENKKNGLVIPDREYRDSLDDTQKEIFDTFAKQISRESSFIIYQEKNAKKIAVPDCSGPVFLNNELIPTNIKHLLKNNNNNLRIGDGYLMKIKIGSG